MYHSSLERVRQVHSMEVVWKAFELQPREVQVSPEEQAAKAAYIKQSWPRVQQMAKDVYGLHMEAGALGVDTRDAHIGLQVARELGQEEAYAVGVFKAHWQEGKDISDRGVLTQVAHEANIPAKAFAKGLEDERHLRAVMEEQAEARLLGVRGVPATLVNGEHLLSGCRPAKDLERIFNLMAQQQGS